MHTDTNRKPRPLLKALLTLGASLFLAAFGLGVYHSILTHAQLPGIHFSPWSETESPRNDEEYTTAVSQLKLVIAMDPNSRFQGYVLLGDAHRDSGNYDLGLAAYKKAISHRPRRAGPYDSAASLHAQLGQYEEAITLCSQAIGLKPDFAEAYYNRANLYRKQGQVQSALNDLEQAITLMPGRPELYFIRGEIFNRQGALAPAVKDYTKAIELKPDYVEALAKRAEIYQQSEKHQKALDDYLLVMQLNPDYPEAYNNVAWLFATCRDGRYRDPPRAVGYATKACELFGWKNQGALDTLAVACAENGEFAAAVKWQTKAIELAPADQKEDLNTRLELYANGKSYTGQ